MDIQLVPSFYEIIFLAESGAEVNRFTLTPKEGIGHLEAVGDKACSMLHEMAKGALNCQNPEAPICTAAVCLYGYSIADPTGKMGTQLRCFLDMIGCWDTLKRSGWVAKTSLTEPEISFLQFVARKNKDGLDYIMTSETLESLRQPILGLIYKGILNRVHLQPAEAGNPDGSGVAEFSTTEVGSRVADLIQLLRSKDPTASVPNPFGRLNLLHY